MKFLTTNVQHEEALQEIITENELDIHLEIVDPPLFSGIKDSKVITCYGLDTEIDVLKSALDKKEIRYENLYAK